jgi:adenylate cyclase
VSDATRALIEDAGTGAARLAELWRTHDADEWRATPGLYAALARRFLSAGDPVLAHEVLTEARSDGAPRDPWLEHLYGLVLARSGAPERAAELAAELHRDFGDDPKLDANVLGLLGRTEKDLAGRATDERARRTHLRRSFAIYRMAFRRTGKSYGAINAATLALLLGWDKPATDLAVAARECALLELQAAENAGQRTYWEEATLAEAALIIGDMNEAARRYGDAARSAAGELSDLSSMRKQARLILAHRGEGSDWLDRIFGIPRVVVFAGISPIAGGDAGAGGAALAAAIRERLDELDAGFGFSAAAAGCELVFLEAMKARGGRTTVVLPCARDEFVRRHIAPTPDPAGWAARFEAALAGSVEVIEASRSLASTVAAEYGALLLIGLAGMQAQILDTELVPLVAWDGTDSPGSPAATVRLWEARGHTVQRIAARAEASDAAG